MFERVSGRACACLLMTLLAGRPALAAAADPAPSPHAAAAAEGTVKIRIAHVYDENYPWHKAFERFRDVAQAKSGGSLSVQIYPNGVLGNESLYVSLLRSGALDVAVVSTAAVSQLVPEVSFFDLMYLFKSYDHWKRALDGKLGDHMSEVIRRSTSKAGTPGLEVLGYWSGSPANIVGHSRAYQTVQDLEGMKIRSQGLGVQMEQWKLLGARPVVVAYESINSMLRDGLLDATPSVVPSTYSMKFYEVAPYISETAHTFIVRICVMSGFTWNKLSSDQRAIVVAAMKEATVVARDLENQQNDELAETMRSKLGVKFAPFKEKDLMRERTQSVRQEFAEQYNLTEPLAALEAEWGAPRSKAR